MSASHRSILNRRRFYPSNRKNRNEPRKFTARSVETRHRHWIVDKLRNKPYLELPDAHRFFVVCRENGTLLAGTEIGAITKPWSR